ncbi:MAG: UDP-N-acetylmuramoyl-tripeptide--D-alanyl-D-alanine ligase [Bacteroidia bacterium]
MIEHLYQKFTETGKVCTDTRNIIQGSIFFALKGPNFNANLFAIEALNRGAAFAVIDEDINVSDNRLILVDDVLTALQQLATYHRKKFDIPVIAVTGTNGKTTTKELLKRVLSKKYNTLATVGNLNNHIGVPLTLLSIDKTTTAAVIEMGANHQKEIEMLCKIAEPTHGLITNVGKAHLEGFGSFEGVIKGKTEMYTYLKNSKGVIFCNYDNQLLQPLCAGYDKVFYYGTSDMADIKGTLLNEDSFLKLKWRQKKTATEYDVSTQIAGRYNFENLLAALAVGCYFNVEAELINNAIETYIPSDQRSQLIKKGSTSIMLDAYNANPTSMREAILNFDKNFVSPKIVLLGDMFELGNDELEEHRQLIMLLKECNFNKVVLVGERFAVHKGLIDALFFENSKQAGQWLSQQNISNTNILIKGSRGSKMELVLQHQVPDSF